MPASSTRIAMAATRRVGRCRRMIQARRGCRFSRTRRTGSGCETSRDVEGDRRFGGTRTLGASTALPQSCLQPLSHQEPGSLSGRPVIVLRLSYAEEGKLVRLPGFVNGSTTRVTGCAACDRAQDGRRASGLRARRSDCGPLPRPGLRESRAGGSARRGTSSSTGSRTDPA
jgi:hypothetical protein